jgi:hypothetical protein
MIESATKRLETVDALQWVGLEQHAASNFRIHQTYEWAVAKLRADNESSHFLTITKDGKLIGGLIWTEARTKLGKILLARGGPLCIPGFEGVVGPKVAEFVREQKRNYLAISLTVCPGLTRPRKVRSPSDHSFSRDKRTRPAGFFRSVVASVE